MSPDLLKLLPASVTPIELSLAQIVGAVSALSLIIWAVIHFAYKTRIESLRGRLELSDDRVKDYEIKLKGAEPDEAKKRIDDLEAAVSAMSAELKNLGEIDFVAEFEKALKDRTMDGGSF